MLEKKVTDKLEFEEECFTSFKEVVKALEPIRTTLWDYYKKNGYDNLPWQLIKDKKFSINKSN